MLIKTSTAAADTGGLLTRKSRLFGVTRGLILSWRDRPHLLWEIYMFGAPPPYPTQTASKEAAFIAMMRDAFVKQSAENPQDTPSLNANMTDAEYGEVYEGICAYVKMLADRGAAFRRRKDWRG